MTSSSKDFEASVSELKDASGNINAGLERVLQLLDTFGERNAAVLASDTDEAPASSEAALRVRSIVGAIRSQILDITEFSREFEKKVEAYGQEIIELSQELEESKKAANLDPLTGVMNRTRFEDILGRMLSDVASMQGQLAIFLADMDNFQNINDQLGEKMGDQMLRLVARTFVEGMKGADVISRWGSDEFAAILPATSLQDAATVAGHIRENLASRVVRNRETGETLCQLTVSIGIAGYRDGDNRHKLMARADRAVFNAKQAGKNRVATDENMP